MVKNNNQGRRRPAMNRESKQTSGGDSKLVPWSRQELTDSMKLTPVPATVFKTIKSYSSPGFMTQSGSVPVFTNFSISAGFFQDFGSLAAVFDQYRITMLEVTLWPQTTEGIPTTTVGPPKGFVRTVIDYDDAANLTVVGAADAYANCITTEVTSPIRRCWKPRIAVAAYAGSTFTGFVNSESQWLDAASSSIVYYGLKFAIDNGTTGNVVGFDLSCRALFEWRASR